MLRSARASRAVCRALAANISLLKQVTRSAGRRTVHARARVLPRRQNLVTLIERRYRRIVLSSEAETSLTISAMKAFLLFCVVLLGSTLSIFAADKVAEKLKPAPDVITPDALLAHIKILSSDEFEGRSPGSKGEELSRKSRSTVPISCLSVTASSRRNTAGTIIKVSMFAAKRS